MLLADVVETGRAVAATGARNAKIDLLAELFERLDPEEVPVAVAFLAGVPRQGRIGVGWARLMTLDAAPASVPALRIADLDGALDAIARTAGAGSDAARATILLDLFARATAGEQDFIRRLLVGDMRQGALEGVVTEAIARAAGLPGETVRRALMLSGDLGGTAAIALREGAPGLAAVRLRVLRPILPMLASPAGDVATALDGMARASVEWKLDGIRIQAHKLGDEVRVYSRNLNDVGERVPEIVAAVRALPAGALVLDGEAIAFDDGARAFFFDVLHAGGEDLIDRPLAERLDRLDAIARPLRIPATTTADPSEAGRFLADALAAGHEGVMVKDLSSPYLAGRRGRAWRKVKRALTLDLVVLGAEWGHGRRRGWLSNLHLGARDPAGGFVMVGKTFKGLTDEVLRWQTVEILAREDRRSGITVFARPELVVEIELDGARASSRYPGGVALRFARVLRYRPDKDTAGADTIDAVRALAARAGA